MVNYNVKLIEDYLTKMNISKREFCLQSDIPLNTLDRIFKNDGKVIVEIVLKIASVLNVSLDDFLNGEPLVAENI